MKHGGLIAYPTEGVWGLGCDPADQVAVARLLALKSRPVEKGLILVGSEMPHFAAYTENLGHLELQQIESSLGQAITWLVDHGGSAPEWISGGQATLAIRLTDHPVVVELCRKFGGAIVSTSANPAGEEPAVNEEQVQNYFGKLIDVIVPGATGGQNGATEIRELETGRIVRPKAQ